MSYFYSLIFGLVSGSFANVCILRLPKAQSVAWPGSRCPQCGHRIKAIHNIPLVSFIALKGRCFHCQTAISYQYPLIELTVAVLFVFHAYWFSGSILHIILADGLSFALLALSVIDYRHRIIPDELSLSLLVIGLLFSFVNPYISGAPWIRFLHSFAASIGGGLLMLALAWGGEKAFKKEALGGGDLKLIAASGAILGWQGVIGPLLIGSLSGAFVAVILLLLKKKKLGETLPFGPFLSLGAYLTCLFPAWYVQLISQK
jgi:leader peptidase (prepilin peptidase)/N-methyltransferase